MAATMPEQTGAAPVSALAPVVVVGSSPASVVLSVVPLSSGEKMSPFGWMSFAGLSSSVDLGPAGVLLNTAQAASSAFSDIGKDSAKLRAASNTGLHVLKWFSGCFCNMHLKASGSSQILAFIASVSKSFMYSATILSNGPQTCGHALKQSGANDVTELIIGFCASGHAAADTPVAPMSATTAAARRAMAASLEERGFCFWAPGV
mmetsp:Transcript_93598/g.183516  ORF Transcript_93598/g.183516 Transcript_93598/m.183516 type:complete len:205 (-) Transcript_93598:22-636(-)